MSDKEITMWMGATAGIWIFVGVVFALIFYARELWLDEINDASYVGAWWRLSDLGAWFAALWPLGVTVAFPLVGIWLLCTFIACESKRVIRLIVKRAAERKRAIAREEARLKKLADEVRHYQEQGPHR